MESVPLTATEIVAGIRAKTFSASDVTEAALKRAEALNPKIKAFNTILGDIARAAAKKVDADVAAGKVGKLAGVPIALKDNLCLKGTRTTCSSKILENYVPPYTATAVQRLLDEGGIPIGKTNLDEFAMGSSTENSAFVTTRNPWNTECVPGGSSGGSAAAVAAAIAPVSLGSDTGGSIRQPASLCGISGFKPTYGRISRYGLIAFASSLDQIGPFTRSVEDAALVTAVMSGKDDFDATSAEIPVPQELYSLRAPESLKGVKLGIPKEYFIAGTDPQVDKAIRATIDEYRAMGAETVDISLPNSEHAVAVYYIVATAEASSNLARFDGVHYGHRTKEKVNLVDLYSKSRAEGFGAEVKRRIMLGTYALSSGYYDAYYLKAQKVRALVRNDFLEAFKKCDAIICPTSPTAAFKIGEKSSDPLSMYLSDIFTISANLAAIPGISIPCGFTTSGLPIGVQLMGKDFDESGLLKIAMAYQARTKHHLAVPKL
ncbi:MAG TPA: Asp-tRNA(Asn)/Glu-tRNA(Gln) amidotransferase subunit GatA [Planctomycetota bacterium]|nr:Asp-tRNA(Asn)/Glu-tRNA(Gln) amidotransferase subunit GatA [Planctomycetota bacterium]